MKTTLRWFARLVDQKGVGLAGVRLDLQVFDRTANGWVAVASTMSSATGLVRGTVTDANDGLPVVGATVEAVGSGRSTHTDADGGNADEQPGEEP